MAAAKVAAVQAAYLPMDREATQRRGAERNSTPTPVIMNECSLSSACRPANFHDRACRANATSKDDHGVRLGQNGQNTRVRKANTMIAPVGGSLCDRLDQRRGWG